MDEIKKIINALDKETFLKIMELIYDLLKEKK